MQLVIFEVSCPVGIQLIATPALSSNRVFIVTAPTIIYCVFHKFLIDTAMYRTVTALSPNNIITSCCKIQ